MPQHQLSIQTYLDAIQNDGLSFNPSIIHNFLGDSYIQYFGGKCPIYQVKYRYDNRGVVIGGNYATNGKPKLRYSEPLDFK